MLYISALTLFSKQNIFATREYLIFLLELCYIAKKMFYVIDQNFTLCHRFVQFSMFCIKIRLMCVRKSNICRNGILISQSRGKMENSAISNFGSMFIVQNQHKLQGEKIRKKFTFETINGDFFKFQLTKFHYTTCSRKRQGRFIECKIRSFVLKA